MKKLLLAVISISILGSVYSQSQTFTTELSSTHSIDWLAPQSIKDFDESQHTLLNFKSAHFNFPYDSIPLEKNIIQLPLGTNSARAEIEVLESQPLSLVEEKTLMNNSIDSEVSPAVEISYYRKKALAIISFHPIYRNSNGNLVKVIKYNINVSPEQKRSSRVKLEFADHSVLRSGNWAKVGVTKDGIYKLSYEDLQSLGLNPSNLNSSSIRLFGNGGGYLPFRNDVPRIDDLEENPIKILDGGDGTFGPGDQFLFYGQSAHRWKFQNGKFRHFTHIFSDTTYYFISTDYAEGTPKRISTETAVTDPADATVSSFTDHKYHEVDLVNFVKSGRNWYGEAYNFTKSRTFNFEFPNVLPETAEINSLVAIRVIGTSRVGTFSYTIGGNKVMQLQQSGLQGHVYADYAKLIYGTEDFIPQSSTISVKTDFLNPSTSDNAFLDFIEIVCKRELKFTGNQMAFRHEASRSASVIQYNLSGFSNKEVWDVTDPTNAKSISVSNGNFKAFGGQINEYIGFSSSNYLSPVKFGKISNQNLHAIQQADYVIVTHPKFINQAKQLAEFHRNFSQLNTVVVTTTQIYNEFSSGSQDITAIKMFNKMLYDRAGSDDSKMLKYVLLMGDASYDYKYRITDNTNYVPGYQSSNSHAVLGSYISDDYVGFLDDHEGDELGASLDVGIGRIMARNVTQAQDIVDKTIHYMQNEKCMRQWRNWITYVGDDEDSLIHMIQSDSIARKIDTTYRDLNINKIYLDAYQQISNAGGSTYPDVNTAIDKATERGSLILTYIGHGGELGWAHERVLGLSQINNYSNFNSLALYLTATCEFSRFDDPDRTSAGEYCLINPQGSALALLTTTRLVYSAPNFELTWKFFEVAFEKQNGEWPRLGDLLRISKVGGNNINYRNFSLLGDPAARLAYPEYGVETTIVPDTIKSLQKITMKGFVTDEFNNKNTNYNGIIYPTIFGKKRQNQTLNNDGHGVFPFETQTNTLFNGKASVVNGEFEFTFIVPKDIDFNYGYGKASFYAENSKIDASGHDISFVIGGRDGDPTADEEGPTIELWMNDESFVMGGVTDESPLIYAKIFDESGINTVGSGIGHDIVAVIDENTANSITLNEYYESEIDSYQKGSVSYALNNLPDGRHTLRLKAWDVYNNSGEAYTEFVVSHSGEFQIKNVLNYPNPFTTNTDFYFEHNALGQQIDVRIQIFTVSGKLVKTIDHSELSESYRIGPINWDGRDQFGDRIGKGTYVYKVKATNAFGKTVEKFEKIVIL